MPNGKYGGAAKAITARKKKRAVINKEAEDLEETY